MVLSLIILGELIWFLSQRICKNSLSEKTRRRSIHFIKDGFILFLMLVMYWHLENYIPEKHLGSLYTRGENQNLEDLS